jgi:hypothetical protein
MAEKAKTLCYLQKVIDMLMETEINAITSGGITMIKTALDIVKKMIQLE